MLTAMRSGSSAPLLYGPFELGSEALLAMHALQPTRYPFLLESAASGSLAEYDLLLALPGRRLSLTAADLRRARAGTGGLRFLAQLDAWWRQESVTSTGLQARAEVPFAGGWFLYLGYELAAEIEPTLALPLPEEQGVVAQAVRVPAAIVRDRARSRAWIVMESHVADRLPELRADLARALTSPGEPSRASLARSLEEEAPERFIGAVEQALQHVAAGDIYQANLSRSWRGRLAEPATAIDVYRQLRAANPAPFAALAVVADRTIVSSSPERLIRLANGSVATRPIAGTRPRGATQELDDALVRELRDHPKERAEHVMLLDLERNDLGRICRPGTVWVDEYMVIESYAHVHHIVSNVRGQLRADTTPGAVIAAVFPGGTITGCPKIRCMDIIGALEGTPRGAYTGSLGYLGRDGNMDLNILIRTIEITGRELSFRAGAGIVAESQPQRELEETRAKALGLIRALDGQERIG